MHSRSMARALIVATIVMGVAGCGDQSSNDTADTTSVNHPPVISGTPTKTAIEGQSYTFTPKASDPDGDTLTFSIQGKPGWMDFDTSTGTLSGTPKGIDVGKHKGIVITASDGTDSTSLSSAEIDVVSSTANQAPQISGTPAASVIAGDFYDFIPVASDPDGDVLSFTIENAPPWADFDPVIGRLSGTPTTADIGSYGNILISVSDGIASASLDAFVIAVNPPPTENSAPVISGIPDTSVLAGNAYAFTPTALDADGDTVTFEIFNQPSWASFDTATGALTGTPATSDVGNFSGISIVASDGQASSALPSFSIEVVDPNSPPVISGTPPTSVTAGDAYSFTPSASDADGDSLSFSVSGLPSWASFDSATGGMTGNPGSGDVGSYGSIVITVSDGSASDSLGPFSVEVTAANGAPVISGTPASSVVIGQSYSFTPSASDPDNDSLSFSVSGLPSWASLNSGTGSLTGTPTSGDVGIYSNIVITVSDGSASDSLGPFSIEVIAYASGSATLTWTPPTENTDGSALTDLAGYTVYWGQASGDYSNSVTLANPGITSYVVDNLLAGTTYYFATTAYNSDGLESSFSNEASKTIQ
jgi:hypothetical protein